MSQYVFLYRESSMPTPKELEARMAKCLVWFEDLQNLWKFAGLPGSAPLGHPSTSEDQDPSADA